MADEKRDYRQEVTADIIKLLESGTAPWQKPWRADGTMRLPMNPTTGKPYRGGNVMWPTIQNMRKGYGDPRWMTYKQSADNGWQVRKGEKGSQIEFWDVGRSKDDGESDADKSRYMIHRIYTVFNAQQIDGVPAVVVQPFQPREVCEVGERILANSGADIVHAGERAFYNRGTDRIYPPPKELFPDAPGYYGTSIHEMTHWTGHEKRLNRETLNKSRACSHDDEHYAREELVAEIGSMMLAAEKGIPHDPEQHAAYADSWLKALKKDKNEVFRAASAASRAADYILNLEKAVAHDAADEQPRSHVERVQSDRSILQR